MDANNSKLRCKSAVSEYYGLKALEVYQQIKRGGDWMNSGYNGPINDLDRIRRTRGIDTCRNIFRNMGKECKQNAIRLVNGDRLLFASLFVLQPEIKELNLNGELSERDHIALSICEKIIQGKKSAQGSNESLSLNSETAHTVMLWMFHTGVADDGLNNEFDQIMDIVASILIKTHHEKAILPGVTNLIFRRNEKGLLIHNLTWALFQTHDVYALRLIAGYLRSSVQRDVDLARTLLHLPQEATLRTNFDKQKQYAAYMNWLNENGPYIYFTGESFQFTHNPTPCNVNLEAKYLCKGCSPRRRELLTPPTEDEVIRLNNFKGVKEEEKTSLAKYSQTLHDQNPPYWNQWMQYPVVKQIEVSKNGRRELL